MNYPFFLGRNALYAVGSSLKSRGFNSIMMPAYSCGDEVEVFARLGFEIDFYDVYFDLNKNTFSSPGFNIKDNQVLFRTDYFGMKTDLNNIDKTCDFLVIDCAYKYQNSPVPEKGRYYVYSLRKQLNRPHGGLVVTNEYMDCNTLEPNGELIKRSALNYINNKNANSSVGIGIFDNKSIVNNFGPRFEEFGGYSIGYACMKIPDAHEIRGRSDFLKNRFNSVFNIMKDIADIEDCLFIADAMRSKNVNHPTFFPIYTEAAYLLRECLIRNGFNKSLVFWDRFNDRMDYSMFPLSLKLKSSVLCINLMVDWSGDDMRKLETGMREFLC